MVTIEQCPSICPGIMLRAMRPSITRTYVLTYEESTYLTFKGIFCRATRTKNHRAAAAKAAR